MPKRHKYWLALDPCNFASRAGAIPILAKNFVPEAAGLLAFYKTKKAARANHGRDVVLAEIEIMKGKDDA